MRAARTATVPSDAATITYDVHGDLAAGRPLLVIGSPMTADGFTELVAELGDRPVITYDPRGCGRSPKDDPTSLNTPEQHAADLQRVVDAAGVHEVDVFATSGGAVNALAWVVGRAPVRTLVAHEPPIFAVLPDRDKVSAMAARMFDTYDRDGHGPGMAQFIALVMHRGQLTEDDLDVPAPDPATFGLTSEDSGDRTDPLLWQNRPCTAWEPDIDALRASSTRLVVGVGEESREVISGRAALALSDRLGLEAARFPGGHVGFASADHPGADGDPPAFAARLREVLDG